MIEKLIRINDSILEKDTLSEDEKSKYLLIDKLLKTENVFGILKIEYAYAILRDLGFAEEELKSIYMELISPEEGKNNE